ncbi:cache domain-containing protein [Nitratidesulfovibrio liaohensis]|uniref:histidine kinase n=1 Tax=Nitratidesulfovibrio liaohensis TaxID=2604158 RepID=A0ABY9R6C3_9BACT|nr:cache domain-containing protein [Nitratidesulfovibrio liaohensis]WMW66757.1 cache domain-containing protein [Nitratidesulfovibrio liaohensis]
MTGLGIRGKLLASYMLVFLVLLLCGGAGAYIHARNAVEQVVEERLHAATQSILGTVRVGADLAVRNYLRAASEKARDVVALEYERYRSGAITEAQAKANAADILLRMSIGRSGYIYCLTSNATLAVHPVASLLGRDLSEFEFVRDQSRLREGFMQYEWRNPGETHARPKALHMTWFQPWDWIISASAYREEFRNLLDVTMLRDAVLSHRVGETGYAYIMTGAGELLVHPVMEPGDIADARDDTGRRFVREMMQKRSGRIVYSWRNPGEGRYREKIVVYAYLADYDWIVAASGYTDEIYAPLDRMRRLALLWLLAAVGVVALASLYASAGITGPLRRLTERVRVGAGGDLSVRVVPETHDEIGDLANYFNRLMGNLEGHSLRMGQLVEARTTELTRLNADYLVELERRAVTEEEARSRLAFLQALMNAIPNPLYYRDFTGRFVDCNDSFARVVLGCAREDVRGRPPGDFPDVYPADVAGAVLRDDDELRHVGGTRFGEQSLRCADGAVRHFSVVKTVFAGGTAGEGGIIGVLTDLTARRRAEDARRLLEQAVENFSGALLILDGEGSIRYANPAFAAITGWPRTNAVDRRLADLGAEDTAGAVAGGNEGAGFPALLAARAQGKAWSGRARLRRGDGASFEAECRLAPLRDGAGAVTHFVCTIEDVSERLLLQAQLLQAQKLESIGQLASGIAHEINTPIQFVGDNARFLGTAVSALDVAIAGYDALLRQAVAACGATEGTAPGAAASGGTGDAGGLLAGAARLREETDVDFVLAELPAAVRQVQDGVERVSGIVRALREFSHPDVGGKVPVDVNAGLANTVTVCRNEWKYVAEVHLDLAPDLPHVMGHAGDLNQVFMNLLVNAAHAVDDRLRAEGVAQADAQPGSGDTARGLDEGTVPDAASGMGVDTTGRARGHITTCTRIVDGEVLVRVRDDGTGIAPEVLPRIFDPFFTTKEVGRGTGQGLAIARNLVVNKHGGRIEVDSKPGEGAEFTVYLPVGTP